MKYLKKFEKFALKPWQEDQVNSILDKMRDKNYQLTNSEKAILDNYRNDNKDIEDIVDRIKEIKSQIYKIETEEYDENSDLEAKKEFLKKLSPLKSELYNLEDELMFTYGILDATEVGLDGYSE